MKTLQKILAFGILAFACSMGAAAQVNTQGVSLHPAVGQLSGTWTFTSASAATGGFSVEGLSYWQFFFIPSGTVTTCAVSFDSSTNGGTSFSVGGIETAATIGSCASAGSYANSSASTPTTTGQLTPTITGTGSVTVILFGYVNTPASGSGGPSSNVAVTNFPSTQPVSLATAPTTPTQPLGFSAVIAAQRAVTASAAALPTNSVHGFCVKALSTNSITVYVGPSGVTDSTGYPLNGGDSICYQGSNTNLAYVIASTTGASVAVTGN